MFTLYRVFIFLIFAILAGSESVMRLFDVNPQLRREWILQGYPQESEACYPVILRNMLNSRRKDGYENY